MHASARLFLLASIAAAGLLLPTVACAQVSRVTSLAEAIADGSPGEVATSASNPSDNTASTDVENHIGESAPSSAPDLTHHAAADEFYCQRRGLGTWFYCDPPKRDDAAAGAGAQPSATEQVDAMRRKGDELRNRAILDPSEANVIAYMQYQRKQTDMASTLADMWGRVLIAHPELDYTQQRPVSNLGKANWAEQRQSDIEATMRALNDRYGVFFFYDTTSKASQIEAPIMRSLADTYGLTVVAVSEDGGASVEFPGYVVDHGERERMGLPGKVTPAVALFDTVTRKAILIASGITAADDVMQRIFILTKTRPGEDF